MEVDEEGRPTESFAPDFYLPELDLYIELTTLRQSLVTKKNRKLRHLKELYPEINIKLLYRRDFRSLMMKYGLTAELNAPQDNGSNSRNAELVQENGGKEESRRTEEKLNPE